MGILTRLRNAFGRPRKSQTAEAEGAAQTTPAEPTTSEATPTAPAATPKVPSPSPEPTPGPSATVPEPRDDEHDLVSAAFDKITVPRPADSTESTPTPPADDRRAEETPPITEKPTEAKTEAEPETPAVAEEPTETEPETPAAAEEPTETQPEAPAVAEKPTPAEPETPAVAEKPTPTDEATAEKLEAAPADETTAPTDTKAQTEPEPAAADGDPAPQGPPAPDDESSTGGAGGNKTAEGEAEATKPAADTKPKRKPTPKTAAAPAPEPAAADGDPAPQGPPAADDESSTVGAGGNNTAEGEAEATKPAAETKPKRKPTPKTEPKAKAKPEPKAATEPKPDPEPKAEEGPALPLTRVKTRAPGLTTAYKAATTTLDAHNLTGTRARVYLVLDRSASMRPYYKDGSAQALAEQTLALAAHLDPEATVPVVFFSTELDGTGEITLTDHENKIDDLHAGLGRMGRTSYHAAVEAVLAHHDKTAADPTNPALVVFQTDGAPDAKTPATQALTDAAKTHPTVFFSFVAFGDPENKAFDYLRKLKTPNTSHFLAGETPRELTDKELYEGVLANWRP
ncbi:VWA domain-containing protein [Streptomyces massasporeus]